MKPAIEVKHVWKTYRRGNDRKYKNLRDAIMQWPKWGQNNQKNTFQALEDISFIMEPGESLGIIGRNGAGKSTLLKILSRITPPTQGEVKLRGRVASLLEVGTGFHSELTGRENIFFNGSILGMKYAEIRRKMDEIVDFSGVSDFLDTPIKHYSSGMQMRLAFSVAAHLDAEILVIDEVLAVGDLEFQQKCIGKMDKASREDGRTVLFVSHDLSAVADICQRGIFLDKGKIIQDDAIRTVINTYQNTIKNAENTIERISRPEALLTILKYYILEDKIVTSSQLSIRIHYDLNPMAHHRQAMIAITIMNKTGQRIAWISTDPFSKNLNPYNGVLTFEIADLNLYPGDYYCDLYAEVNYRAEDRVHSALHFTVGQNADLKYCNRIPDGYGDTYLKFSIKS